MIKSKRFIVEYSTQSLENAIEIVAYLRRSFTEREIHNFYESLTGFERVISTFPTLYSESKKKKIRRAVLSKVLSIYYLIKKDKIYIIAILDTRWE